MSSELELRRTEIVQQDEMSIEQLEAQVAKIQRVMRSVMKDGEHYGKIPGTGNKPTLFKAGAEKLMVTFRLGPDYVLDQDWHNEHLNVTAKCTLHHIPTGNVVASAYGFCTTQEPKYARRRDGSPNPRIADTYNTVIKMAQKRALVAAVLNATAASDIFTQDLEEHEPAPPRTPPAAAPAPKPMGKERLEELETMLQLVAYATELWSDEAVCANASRKFGRKISKLSDMSDGEAAQIIAGAQHYFKENPPTVDASV